MPGNNDTLKVAIIQYAPIFLNLEASVRSARRLVVEAAGEGAELVVFPETWLPGYPVWLDAAPGAALWDHPPAKALYRVLVDNALEIPGKEFMALLDVARDAGVHLVMGVHERDGGTLYNSLITLHRDGDHCTVHRKLMPTYTERLIWGRGDGSTLTALETDHGVLGGLICWEHWMPLARAAMHAKRETIHVAQWPWVKELHHIASRHYAFEGQCFVLAAGSVLSKAEILEGYRSLDVESAAAEILESIPGDTDSLVMRGGSAVIGPDAAYVAGPVYDEACIVYADLNLDLIAEGHLTMDSDGHYARPDVFRLEVNDQPQRRVIFGSERGRKEGTQT
jgi:predicted amidohydrolase